MKQPSPIRGIAFLALKFTFFAPACIVLWCLLLPAYATFLGHMLVPILQYLAPILAPRMAWVTPVAVESFQLAYADIGNPEGIFNTAIHHTGIRLVFLHDGGQERSVPLALLIMNVAPFAALMLATAALGIKRRLKLVGIGLAILVLAHMGFLMMAFLMQGFIAAHTEIADSIGKFCITLPFLLWIVLAYRDRLSAFFDNGTPTAPEASEERDKEA